MALAVKISKGNKSYGKNQVLKNFSMQVRKGTIYGLLGASGCGKTTLMSCIVGRRHLKSGDIWVLGGAPGTKSSGVPGPRLGYMPQEIALVGEFTVRDVIYYFGRIFGMSERRIKERFSELSTLLDLPHKNKLIKECSGGQQRRISFAASMVQSPELLILDEPTVGVDPILRERIWDYLVQVTNKTQMTVILTTHYIEEAKQANTIGLMRDGCLLIEESPNRLLEIFQTEYLEEVFLILSQRQEQGRLNELNATLPRLMDISTEEISGDVAQVESTAKISSYTVNRKRMKALLGKNFKQLYRNLGGLAFTLVLPVIQCYLFLLTIGPDVADLPLAIVNEETRFCSILNRNTTTFLDLDRYCHLSNASCRFLDYLDHPMINKKTFATLEEGTESVRRGESIGVLYMGHNFSNALQERMKFAKDIKNDVLDAAKIKVWMDLSNRQTGSVLMYKLLQLYRDFQLDVFRDCDYNPKVMEFLKVDTIYGSEEQPITNFMTPGLVLTIMFFQTAITSCHIILGDRIEGLWDRSVIAGVSSLEIVLSHFVIQAGIVVIYTVQILVITFAIYKVSNVGSIWILSLITFLEGLAGVTCGFTLSVSGNDMVMVNIAAGGIFVFIMFISGVIWPIEGMPVALQWMSQMFPVTIPSQSFRNVMEKGWSLDRMEVFSGLGVEAVWVLALATFTTVLLNIRK